MTREWPAPGGRGLLLLSAHCRSLDPGAPTAQERLERALGPELAHVLLFALAAGGAASLHCAVG
jgi:hypothetical protein